MEGEPCDGEPQDEETAMKYFTRDLYRRCRSTDEAVLDAACEEWEQANQAYERHLEGVESQFPDHLREFAALLLHDAKVLSIARQADHLIMVLHKDIPPRDLVILRYELAGEPTVEPFAEAPDDWSRPTDFQFDELDLVQEGGRPVYSQCIVFGNGWLLRVRFWDLRLTVAQPIYPTSAAGVPPGVALAHAV
jgi:hypothetical protein